MSFDLPTLPQDWSFLPLEDCAAAGSISYGVVQPGSPVEGGVPIIRVNNFRNARLDLSDVMRIAPEIESKYGRTRLSGGEVLLTLVGSVGQVAEVPAACKGFNVARAVGVIKPINGIDAKWIALCLRSPLSQHILGTRANTTVQTTINLKDVRALPIPIPPPVERLRIADFISALDDRITLLRETNATLEAIAQALFMSWFVDFDPVRAKQQGLVPTGMDESTAALFPDSFEESALGLVPKGWGTGVLGDVVKTVRSQLQPAELNAAIHYIGLEHLPRKSLSLTNWDSAEGLESAKAKFSEGDILFGKLRPYFHKVVVAPFDGVCSTDILVCQPTQRAFYCFAAMHLFSTEIISYADRLSNGAKMPRISWGDIAAYPLVAPTNAIASAYNDTAAPLLEVIKGNVFQAQTLATLRDTLLPRLISGQLRLPKAAAEMAEAVA
jgi:type I restriction enzyme, S subunit